MKTPQDRKVIGGLFRRAPTLPGSETARPLRVWLVDADEAFRNSLGSLLDKTDSIKCDRGFGSGELLLHSLSREAAPQTIVLDVDLRERNGIDFIKLIKALAPATRVLMLTTLFNHKQAARALMAGASAFLAKSASFEEILGQILACARTDHERRNGHLLKSLRVKDQLA